MVADRGFSFRREHVFEARQFWWDKADGSEDFDGKPPPFRVLARAGNKQFCSAGSGSTLFIEADKGGGIKIPFLRDGFVYFKRSLLAYLYSFCDRTSGITKVYGWNESYAGSGPKEVLSLAADYLTSRAKSTGAERLELWVDGCAGQWWNQWAMMFLADVCNPLSCTFAQDDTTSMFKRVGIYRNVVGHTWMLCDAVHAMAKRQLNKQDCVCTLKKLLKIVKAASHEDPFDVALLFEDISTLKDWKSYVEQGYIKRGGWKIKQARWCNLGSGPNEHRVETAHPTEIWLRNTLDYTEVPRRINIVRYMAYADNLSPKLKKKMEAAEAAGNAFNSHVEFIKQALAAQSQPTLMKTGPDPLRTEARVPLDWIKRVDPRDSIMAAPDDETSAEEDAYMYGDEIQQSGKTESGRCYPTTRDHFPAVVSDEEDGTDEESSDESSDDEDGSE